MPPRMPEQEVIKISDGESDDDVQVMEIRQATRPLNRQRPSRNETVDLDDDVEIIRVNENIHRNQSPGVVLHTPGGELIVPDDNDHLYQDLPTPIELTNEAREREGLENRFRSYEEIERERVLRERAPLLERAQRALQARRDRQIQQQRQRQRRTRSQQQGNRANNFEPNIDLRAVYWRMRNHLYPDVDDQDEDYDDDDDDEDDPDYHLGMQLPNAFLHQHGHHFPPFFTLGAGGSGYTPGGMDEDLPANIMQLIEQRENAEFDKKQAMNLSATDKVQQDLKAKAAKVKNPLSTKIEPEEDYVCVLCGVTLGEGIPIDHQTTKSGEPLAKLQEENDVQAPYQALSLITDADKDLSKRIFVSKCGHAYCGRCVKNISGIKEVLKGSKTKFKKTDKDISNPFLYAPLACVGSECKTKLSGKTTFNELFL